MRLIKPIIISAFSFMVFSSPINAQTSSDGYRGGPYTSDANTILLMHFDGNLNEDASNYIANSHGTAKTFITTPVSGLGEAINFDNGSPTNQSFLTIPYSSDLSMSGNWTIEFWFCINEWDQSHNSWPVPILLPTVGWDTNYYLEIPSTEGRLKYGFHSNDNGAQVLSSQNSITTDTWYHVALINEYDKNLIKLVLRDTNFEKLEEQSSTYTAGTIISTGTQDLRIGNGTAGDNSFNGYIDELRISNVVRDYSYQYNWTTTSSNNFLFHYTNPDLMSEELTATLESKLNNLDNIMLERWDNINLLDRTQKIKVYLYNSDQPYASAPSGIRDWDVGYYNSADNELHIKVPSTVRQLKYFSTLEKAAISVLARYVLGKKYASIHSGQEPADFKSFGFGLFESGYSPDLDLMQSYLDDNNNTLPDSYSTFGTWDQLDDETNVELAYSYVFASIFRYGYIHTIWGGVGGQVWYQIFRLFFLTDVENGGMKKLVDENDFVIYTDNQEVADLVYEGLKLFADQYEESYHARINHPLLVTIFSSEESYTYTKWGSITELTSGGEALSHSCLRAAIVPDNLDTELNRLLVKCDKIMAHEFMHNVFAYLAETCPPSWLNEGSAVYAFPDAVQGNSGINVNNFEYYHDFFWNDNNMFFPNLTEIFDLDGGFGYALSFSSFVFIKDRFPAETLLRFMKRADDFSIIGYSDINEFQRHLYEFLYHQYMPTFLFNPTWNLATTFTPGSNFSFTWDGHYIEEIKIEYSVDGMNTWSSIAEIPFSNGNYSWEIPYADNCVLRFSDKEFSDIFFTYQILGDKPTFGKVLQMQMENSAANMDRIDKSGRLKGEVNFKSRTGQGGSYADFDGVWDVISVQNHPELSLESDWTVQGDFLIENTSGIMNQKPVLLEKISTAHWNTNYSISFNNNGQNHLFFSYWLENGNTIELEVDGAGIVEGNWYTFYFARSSENNIAEARVYDDSGNLLGSKSRQIAGEGNVLTGSGDLFLGSGSFHYNEKCLDGGLDNIIISDTYSESLLTISVNHAPVVSSIPDQSIKKGNSFTTVTLDDFVTDTENSDSQLSWTCSGNSSLIVEINSNRVATITPSSSTWTGSETITFIATDLQGASGSDEVIFTINNTTDINDPETILPVEFTLAQNYPNPFNPTTVIRYGIPSNAEVNSAQHVTLRIYGVLGNLVATLQDGPQSPGFYERIWNADDISSGIYLYVLRAGKHLETKKMILLK